MKKAFTLIELLVVVLIIGILAAIALPQYRIAVEKSRAAEAITNIATIKEQMQLYMLENGLPASGEIGYKDFTSVDLSGGEWKNSNYYKAKNYSYLLSIQTDGAFIEVYPAGYSYYEFVSTTYPYYNEDSPVNGWYNSCITQYTDFGRKICKQYENLGWKYMDAEI